MRDSPEIFLIDGIRGGLHHLRRAQNVIVLHTGRTMANQNITKRFVDTRLDGNRIRAVPQLTWQNFYASLSAYR